MLTNEERQEIEAEIPKYAQKLAVGPEALKIIQKHRGWVTDEGLAEVARLLELAPAELESVATFYPLIFRRPVGRHVILICDTVSCWILGYPQLLQSLTERLGVGLGETTSDNRFTLLPIPCLGACDHAPALMIDEDLHLDLDPGKIDEVLERYP
jgi:NADH-quinone oxidoreductase subunit E